MVRYQAAREGIDALSYSKERDLTNNMLTSGGVDVDFFILAKAYFEDNDPRTPDQLPYWRTFMRALNESYYPGFLIELDDTVQKQGVDAAKQMLQKQSHRH
jgi:hypothetical protein